MFRLVLTCVNPRSSPIRVLCPAWLHSRPPVQQDERQGLGEDSAGRHALAAPGETLGHPGPPGHGGARRACAGAVLASSSWLARPCFCCMERQKICCMPLDSTDRPATSTPARLRSPPGTSDTVLRPRRRRASGARERRALCFQGAPWGCACERAWSSRSCPPGASLF